MLNESEVLYVSIGTKLKALRAQKKETQQQVADNIGINILTGIVKTDVKRQKIILFLLFFTNL